MLRSLLLAVFVAASVAVELSADSTLASESRSSDTTIENPGAGGSIPPPPTLLKPVTPKVAGFSLARMVTSSVHPFPPFANDLRRCDVLLLHLQAR